MWRRAGIFYNVDEVGPAELFGRIEGLEEAGHSPSELYISTHCVLRGGVVGSTCWDTLSGTGYENLRALIGSAHDEEGRETT